jgi:hypothetical protein
LALVVAYEGVGFYEMGADDVQYVECAATEGLRMLAELVEGRHEGGSIEIGRVIEAFSFQGLKVQCQLIGVFFGDLISEDFEAKGIVELGFLKLPDGKRLVLIDYRLVDLLGTVFDQVELNESARIEVDHQRPFRSSSTVSVPVRPLAVIALSKCDFHFRTFLGLAATRRTEGLPRFNTSKVSPQPIWRSISAQLAFISLTETVFM